MIVKICGIKKLDEALAAADAGADMLGFNFYRPSPRYLEPAACARIVKALRRSTSRVPDLVGVFVNMPVPQVIAILDACGLDFAQLHGDEPAGALMALRGRAFKAIRPGTGDAAAAQVHSYRPCTPPANMPDILLDASASSLYGGSGLAADWSLAAPLAQESRLLLAGGLNPDNVADAVSFVRPWGVDVASGVESAPGVKDSARIEAFVHAARSAGANYVAACKPLSYCWSYSPRRT